MKLKLDADLSRHLKSVLIELGHDVLTAADENLLSHPDTATANVFFEALTVVSGFVTTVFISQTKVPVSKTMLSTSD